MGKNTAKIIAALGASALGYQKGRMMQEQMEASKEDREFKRKEREFTMQDRERENAYRTEQQSLIESMSNEIAAAGDDEHARRIATMKGYEQRGMLDAKYGKAGIADMEALRKSTQGIKDEGHLQAYTTFMQTGDPRAAGEVFNRYGKTKINLDSLQAVEEAEPITGQKVRIIRGKTEDGRDFAYNPYVEARKYGGLAGMQAELKERQAKQEQRDSEDRGHKRQLEVVDAQGRNSARVAGIGAADNAARVGIEREKLELMKAEIAERKQMQEDYAKAEAAGDQAAMRRLLIRAHGLPGGGGSGKLDVKTDDFGGAYVVDGRKLTRIDPKGGVTQVDLSQSGQSEGAPSAPPSTGARLTPAEAIKQAQARVRAGYPIADVNAALKRGGYPTLPAN